MATQKPARKSSQQSQVEKQLVDLRNLVDAQEKASEETVQLTEITPDDSTRQKIAKLFVWWYFLMLLLIFIGIPIYNLIAQSVTDSDLYRLELTDTIQTYSAVVGPLIGFVIAYYFKSRGEK